MRALVYVGANELALRDVPEPKPGPGECVVDVAMCGICGSDMHAYHGLDPRRIPPLVLGHEAVGVARDGALAGRRVAINPLVGCGICRACTTGREHLCPKRELIGMRVPGAFAERVAVAERSLTVLDDAVPDADAVLAEPLACGVHAVRLGLEHLSMPAEGVRAVVLGGGAIGLLSALVLRARGVTDLWVAETSPRRREMVAGAVEARTYDPIAGEGPEEADLVVDAVGSGRTRAAASALAAPGGTIAHIGLQDQESGLDTRRLTLQEICFIGTYCYTRADFAAAIDLLAGGLAGIAWADQRPLSDGPAAFRQIDAGTAPPKIVLGM